MAQARSDRGPLVVQHTDMRGGSWNVWQDGEVVAQGIEHGNTKDEMVDKAKDVAKGHFVHAVIIERTNGDIHKVWWNPEFNEIRVERLGSDNWVAKNSFWNERVNTDELTSAHSRQRLVERMKEVQEEKGFRFLTIERDNGTIYWSRQHPLWRRAPNND